MSFSTCGCSLAVPADGLSACLYDEREQRGLHRALQRPGSGARRDWALHPTSMRKTGPGPNDLQQCGGHELISLDYRVALCSTLEMRLWWAVEKHLPPPPPPKSHFPCPFCKSAIITVNLDHCLKHVGSTELFFKVKCPLKKKNTLEKQMRLQNTTSCTGRILCHI